MTICVQPLLYTCKVLLRRPYLSPATLIMKGRGGGGGAWGLQVTPSACTPAPSGTLFKTTYGTVILVLHVVFLLGELNTDKKGGGGFEDN